MRRFIWIVVVLVVVALLSLSPYTIAMAGTPKITAEELNAKLGKPDINIIDVRGAGRWKWSDQKITGAVHEDPEEVEGWAGKYAHDKTLVLYDACPVGYYSARVANKLIFMGFQRVFVLNGGWEAWVQAGFPTEPK